MSSLKSLISNDAKQIVDLLYDTNMFKEGLTRDNLNSIEELVICLLETRVTSQIKKNELRNRISGNISL